jgi:pyruvate dehydrogenase E2 component (dihydrolipoamide acetyltransferase)
VAADAGIDLKDVPNHGRVLAQDILAFLENSREKGKEDEREEVVPMNGMRKAIAKNMLNSHMTSPTVTFNLGVDMTAMKELPRAAQDQGHQGQLHRPAGEVRGQGPHRVSAAELLR